MSLNNKHGYYPCGVIGNIDSLFGGVNGVKRIKEFEKKTWKEIYKNFNNKK